MEKRQDGHMSCPCEYDEGFCLRALRRYPQLQVLSKQSKDKRQNFTRDTSQTKSSYYGTCYPRQTSSAQRQRVPPQRKFEDKRSSEELLALVSLSRPPTENLPSPPSCRNQNRGACQFHLEPPLATNDSFGVNKATQTEKSSCWSKLLKKCTPSYYKRQKPSREVCQEFQREDKNKAKVSSFKRPSELNGQDDSCTEFCNDMAGKSPSMITHYKRSVTYDNRNKRSSCCCVCEEEEECPCKCCCHPSAVLVDANLQTCCAHHCQEKVVQTDARKRECCKCCRCCRDAQNNPPQNDAKARNAKRRFENELADLGRPKMVSQVNRLELFRPRNVAVSRGLDILQEFLLNTMSLDAANNAAEKQSMVS